MTILLNCIIVTRGFHSEGTHQIKLSTHFAVGPTSCLEDAKECSTMAWNNWNL